MLEFIKNWFRDFKEVFLKEIKGLAKDGGVLVIFLFGGLGYPVIYNFLYHNGVVSDTAIAVVDQACCSQSREFIRKVDATRELEVVYKCVDMKEAETLMQERLVNGIIYFPKDFGDNIMRGETGKISVYADMSSFLYYKNLLMACNFVMLDQMKTIQIERYSARGMGGQEVSQLVSAIPYEENNPYNKAFSYTIFFLSAALLVVIQQTMFYGMSLRTGTIRERNRHLAVFGQNVRGKGMGRVVLGRGLAYWLPYMAISFYIAFIVPAMFNFPQRGNFWDIVVLLLFYVTDCVLFCLFWSSFITRREPVMVMLLFMSPIVMFLTGFSWPVEAFPEVWKIFSYIFPSTFGCRAFINMNTAGGDLDTVRELIKAMTTQGCIYLVLASLAVYGENYIFVRKQSKVTENNSI